MMNGITDVAQQLITAIQAGNLAHLHELLVQQQGKNGRRVTAAAVTDDDIDIALVRAARKGCVESCRILFDSLSWKGKRKYRSSKSKSGLFQALREAISEGHLNVVRLFVEECNFNINQMDASSHTHLYYAASYYQRHGIIPLHENRLEIIRILVENGAHPNQAARPGILFYTVFRGNATAVRWLLEHGADPNLGRRPFRMEANHERMFYSRMTDHAILRGHTEILCMLLQHGAFVGPRYQPNPRDNATSLDLLLRNRTTPSSREMQVSITHMLVEHAKMDADTAVFLQFSLEFEIEKADSRSNQQDCAILLEAGIPSFHVLYCAIQVGNISVCRLMVEQYQADPFLEEERVYESLGDHANDATTSPFLAAAHLQETVIFEYFLDLWNERFASTGSKNSDGDYLLHIVCCDPGVSLHAIKVLVDRQADVLAMVDDEEGLLPFHFAANWGASLDVIFYLLQHCPGTLSHVGNAASSATTAGPCPCFPAVGSSGPRE